MSTAPDERAGVLAALLRIDAAGAEVRRWLEAEGVETVLLKGRGVAVRLYDHVWERPYSDVDLLVGPEDRDRAERLVVAQGYARLDREGDLLGQRPYAHTFARADGMLLDLHWSLSGVAAPAGAVWEAVRADAAVLTVGGRPTLVPGDAAMALIVALHAAHHGGNYGATIADLERAIVRVPRAAWVAAAGLAARLGAGDALAAGLALSDAGRRLASTLGARAEPTVEYRLRAVQPGFAAWALHRLMEAPDAHTRAAIVREVLLPPPDAMRRFVPLARRGRLGLVIAYALRPLKLAVTARPALRVYLALRRPGPR